MYRLIAYSSQNHRSGLANRRGRTYRVVRIVFASMVSLLLVIGFAVTPKAHAASVFNIVSRTKAAPLPQREARNTPNLQTMWLPRPATNLDPSPVKGGGDVTIVDDTALMPAEGPSGTLADIEHPKDSTISRYVVRQGDTLSSIATLFKVTPDTVLWANDLPRNAKLQIGQQLIILPVPGVKYTAKKGDTLASIAKRFGGDASEIANFNGIDGDLAVGTDLIIPDGEITVAVAASTPTKKSTTVTSRSSRKIGAEPAHDVGPEGSASEVAYYIAPVSHYIETQGVHGYNAVDLAAPVGTPILASAGGTVIIAREGGWNGGYGSYVVISHDNGSQTLYGHMSRVDVGVGDTVVQSQVIGAVGSTGKSTGSHVHFEIRNGIKNPF